MAKENRQKKEHRRINAFDVAIILLILCLLGALGYRIYQGVSDPDTRKESKYIVEFECEGVYNSLIDYVENGETVYFADSGEILGHMYMTKDSMAVMEIITEETEETETEETDSAAEQEAKPSYETVRAKGQLKLNADAVKSGVGNHFTLGDRGFTAGTVIEVCTSDTVFVLKITNIYAID